jgi:hypothetical protein
VKITIQFDHLVLFATVGSTVRAILPSGGHGAEAALTRNGTTTSKKLPSSLSLKFKLSSGAEAAMTAPAVSSYRMPNLNKVIAPPTGQSLSLVENSVNCVVELRGGNLKAEEPTFDNAEDEQYKDDDWNFGGGLTSKLTNHVSYTVSTSNSAELIDENGTTWHSFSDGDLITISNMDSTAAPKTTVNGTDIELSEFKYIYQLVGNKSSTPANPKTPYRGQAPASILSKILELLGMKSGPQGAPAGGGGAGAPTPDKPICASASITIS